MHLPSIQYLPFLPYLLVSSTLIIGLIGPRCTGSARKMWNEIFREREIDAFFDFYRTNTDRDLELCLSEMFLHERRAYLLDPLFSLSVRPLLDRLDPSAKATQRIDTVINDEGILIGFDTGATLDDQKVEKRLSLFLARGRVV